MAAIKKLEHKSREVGLILCCGRRTVLHIVVVVTLLNRSVDCMEEVHENQSSEE